MKNSNSNLSHLDYVLTLIDDLDDRLEAIETHLEQLEGQVRNNTYSHVAVDEYGVDFDEVIPDDFTEDFTEELTEEESDNPSFEALDFDDISFDDEDEVDVFPEDEDDDFDAEDFDLDSDDDYDFAPEDALDAESDEEALSLVEEDIAPEHLPFSDVPEEDVVSSYCDFLSHSACSN